MIKSILGYAKIDEILRYIHTCNFNRCTSMNQHLTFTILVN